MRQIYCACVFLVKYQLPGMKMLDDTIKTCMYMNAGNQDYTNKGNCDYQPPLKTVMITHTAVSILYSSILPLVKCQVAI